MFCIVHMSLIHLTSGHTSTLKQERAQPPVHPHWQFHYNVNSPSWKLWRLGALGKKQTRQFSHVLLTCQANQHGAHQQVHRQLPMLRHAGHEEGDDDLGWDEELDGIGEEDANGVEQLHRLVQPAERAQVHSKAVPHTHASRNSAKWSGVPLWFDRIYPSYKCMCFFGPSNFISSNLSGRYICTYTQKPIFKIYHCSII